MAKPSQEFVEFQLTIEGYVSLLDSTAGSHAIQRMSPAERSIATNNLESAKAGAFVHSRCYHDIQRCRSEFVTASLIVNKTLPSKVALRMMVEGTVVELPLTAREIVDDTLKAYFDAAVNSTSYRDGTVYSHSNIRAAWRKCANSTLLLVKAVSEKEFEDNVVRLSPKKIFLKSPAQEQPPLVLICNADLRFLRTAYFHNPHRCHEIFRSISTTGEGWNTHQRMQTLKKVVSRVEYRHNRIVKVVLDSPAGVRSNLYVDVPLIETSEMAPTLTTPIPTDEPIPMTEKEKTILLHNAQMEEEIKKEAAALGAQREGNGRKTEERNRAKLDRLQQEKRNLEAMEKAKKGN